MDSSLDPVYVRQRVADAESRIAQLQACIDSGIGGKHRELAERFINLLRQCSAQWLKLSREHNRAAILFKAGEISELTRCKMVMAAYLNAADDMAEIVEKKEQLVVELMALDAEEQDPADWWKYA